MSDPFEHQAKKVVSVQNGRIMLIRNNETP